MELLINHIRNENFNGLDKTEFTDFDHIELLTVHSYDNSIVKKKDE